MFSLAYILITIIIIGEIKLLLVTLVFQAVLLFLHTIKTIADSKLQNQIKYSKQYKNKSQSLE